MSKLKSVKHIFLVSLFLVSILCLALTGSFSNESEVKQPDLESCTSILVGKLASVDGSTMTSHSCDSNTDRTWINVVPPTRSIKQERWLKVLWPAPFSIVI